MDSLKNVSEIFWSPSIKSLIEDRGHPTMVLFITFHTQKINALEVPNLDDRDYLIKRVKEIAFETNPDAIFLISDGWATSLDDVEPEYRQLVNEGRISELPENQRRYVLSLYGISNIGEKIGRFQFYRLRGDQVVLEDSFDSNEVDSGILDESMFIK